MFDDATLQDGWANAIAQVVRALQSAQYAQYRYHHCRRNLERDRLAVSGVNLDEKLPKAHPVPTGLPGLGKNVASCPKHLRQPDANRWPLTSFAQQEHAMSNALTFTRMGTANTYDTAV